MAHGSGYRDQDRMAAEWEAHAAREERAEGEEMTTTTMRQTPAERLEHLERIVEAAERDYAMALGWYCAQIEGRAEGPQDVRQPRADVLQARALMDLLREDLRLARS